MFLRVPTSAEFMIKTALIVTHNYINVREKGNSYLTILNSQLSKYQNQYNKSNI